jgi:hypothetical protein
MLKSQHIGDFVDLLNRLLEAKRQPRLSEGQIAVLSDLLRDMSQSPHQAALKALRTIEQTKGVSLKCG